MNYKSNMDNFIKVHRKILGWQWYKDPNTKIVFLHCLLMANWEPGEWNGIQYKAGEFITSIGSIAAETGLSIQNVRTALKHLEATGEITQKATYKLTQDEVNKKTAVCSVITVNNWTKYQGKRRKPTQNATDNLTTVIEIKERAGLPEGSAAPEEEEWMDPSLALEKFKEGQDNERDL